MTPALYIAFSALIYDLRGCDYVIIFSLSYGACWDYVIIFSFDILYKRYVSPEL